MERIEYDEGLFFLMKFKGFIKKKTVIFVLAGVSPELIFFFPNCVICL